VAGRPGRSREDEEGLARAGVEEGLAVEVEAADLGVVEVLFGREAQAHFLEVPPGRRLIFRQICLNSNLDKSV